MEALNYEEYKKAMMAWKQDSMGDPYDIVEADSEQELRMLEMALSLRPGLYEMNPELKAMMTARIRDIKSKLKGGNLNDEF